jgi:monothiol glutaredoxin
VVGVLEQMGVEYAALDVLPALDPIRQATGEIADWRTFPQLYVKGELVGGCDIVEEMADSGELADLLGVSQPEGEALSAKQELQQDDPQQSPPIQIERS